MTGRAPSAIGERGPRFTGRGMPAHQSSVAGLAVDADPHSVAGDLQIKPALPVQNDDVGAVVWRRFRVIPVALLAGDAAVIAALNSGKTGLERIDIVIVSTRSATTLAVRAPLKPVEPRLQTIDFLRASVGIMD